MLSSRADLCRFFDEVLGFNELEVMTEDRHRLIFGCVHWDQFIFLIAEDDPMRCPQMDHYGFAVDSLADLQGIEASGPRPSATETIACTSSRSRSTTRRWSRSTRSTSITSSP